VPSEFTYVLISRSSCIPEFTKRTPGTFSAASFAAKSRATFSSMGTSIGSRVTGVIHVPLTAGAGASSTGRRCTALAARAMRADSRAAFTTPSFVMVLVAANPHEPFTRLRMPMPYDSESATPVMRRSRVLTDWRR
jgi:hypothetical protein